MPAQRRIDKAHRARRQGPPKARDVDRDSSTPKTGEHAVSGKEPQDSFVGGVGLPGERRGGVREETLLGECCCLLRGFGIRNFRSCDLDAGAAVHGGLGNFAQLGLFFPVLLPSSEDGFMQHGCGVFDTQERPMNANRLRVF